MNAVGPGGSSPAEALASLQIGTANDTEVVIISFLPTAAKPLLRRLNPTKELAADFRAKARRTIKRLQRRDELVLKHYERGYKPEDHEIQWLLLQEVALLTNLDQALQHPGELPLYVPEATSKLDIAVTSVDVPGRRRINLFRVLRPQFRLTRSPKLYAWLQGATYDRLDHEVLVFDESTDVVSLDDYVLVLNLMVFESAFGFLEQLRAQTAESFQAVTEDLRIKGADLLLAACLSDSKMMSKLAGIHEAIRKDANYQAALTMSNLLAFVRARPHIGIQIETVDGAEHFIFEGDLANRWKLLKLLDDQHLKSELTEMNYEANSKTRE